MFAKSRSVTAKPNLPSVESASIGACALLRDRLVPMSASNFSIASFSAFGTVKLIVPVTLSLSCSFRFATVTCPFALAIASSSFRIIARHIAGLATDDQRRHLAPAESSPKFACRSSE